MKKPAAAAGIALVRTHVHSKPLVPAELELLCAISTA
jgi:hypothetical protein